MAETKSKHRADRQRTKKRRNAGGLTPRERLFCEAYTGDAQANGKRAAEMAGYTGSDPTLRVKASQILAKPHVQAELERLRASTTSAAVASREERQQFLTKVMRGEEPGEPKDRIKACEILGKMHGDFVEKREHTISGAAQVVIMVPDNGRARA